MCGTQDKALALDISATKIGKIFKIFTGSFGEKTE